MEQIYATQQDLYEFSCTFKRDAKLFVYWKDILKNMPGKLRREVNRKPTNLVRQGSGKKRVLGYEVHQFVTGRASGELREYLGRFVVLVEE